MASLPFGSIPAAASPDKPATISAFIRRSGGDDYGAQFFMADSISPIDLFTHSEGKRREANGSTTYLFTVENRTAFATNYWVEFGGVT